MIGRLIVCAFLAGNVAACGGGGGGGGGSIPPAPPPPPAAVTIPDPMAYLAQSRGTNGDPTTPLGSGDSLTYWRGDFGPGGSTTNPYQAETSYLIDGSNAVTAWSYPPLGPFDASKGDGGEAYSFDGTTVRITATQDGSAPGVRTFAGPDQWVVFRTDAAADHKCFVAELGAAQAWTCYWRQTINFPGIGAIDSIMSDHYNSGDPAKATAVERIVLGHGWGRIAWQAWNNIGLPTRAGDLATRCPAIGIETPPVDGWVLNDCRIPINVIPNPNPFPTGQLWHP